MFDVQFPIACVTYLEVKWSNVKLKKLKGKIKLRHKITNPEAILKLHIMSTNRTIHLLVNKLYVCK